MGKTAWEQQKAGIKYWNSTRDPGLFWEMRLGKNYVATRGTLEYDSKYILVTGPKNVMNAWEENFQVEGERYVRAYSCTKEKRIQAITDALSTDKRTWVLINFEAAITVPGITRIPWGTVIIDEGAGIKGPDAKISNFMCDNFRNVDHRALLCGFPAPETELDLFMQFKFLHGRFMDSKTFWNFRSRYFERDITGFKWIPKEGVRDQIKALLHLKCSVLRRSDVGKMDRKVYTTSYLQMNSEQKAMYRMVDREFRVETADWYDETVWATEKAIWLHRIAGGFTPDYDFLQKKGRVLSTAKPDDILSKLKDELKGQSILVWYRFRDELFHDVDYFRQRGFKTSFLHGDLNVFQRMKQISDFKTGQTQIHCIMEKLGAKGEDYSIASAAFYRSNEFSGDLRVQSEDRLLHMLKEEPLLYIDQCVEGTLDEVAIKACREKSFNGRELMTKYVHGRTSIKETLVDIVREIQVANPEQAVLGDGIEEEIYG